MSVWISNSILHLIILYWHYLLGDRYSLSAVSHAQSSVVLDHGCQRLLERVAADGARVDVGLRLLEPIEVLLEEDEAIWSLSDQIVFA